MAITHMAAGLVKAKYVARLLMVAILFSPYAALAYSYGYGAYGSITYGGSAPIVTTDSASLKGTSATFSGTITSVGTSSPVVRGFVYGPDINYGATTTDSTGAPFATGSFSATIPSLNCGTTYHFAAYASSSNGVGYGGDTNVTIGSCGGGGPPSLIGTTNSGGGSGGNGGVPLIATSSPSVIPPPNSVVAQPPQIGSRSTFTRNLQFGMRGTDVIALQGFLNARGFILAKSGPGSPGNETSTFGPATYRALVKFQSANKLPSTGFFGPLTRKLVLTAAD